jgi:sugar O-acyltransferase (sialic acid O-acetyltransferase NeuD family)
MAEVAELNGHQVTGCYSLTPGHFADIHRGYEAELLRERAEYDGVLLCVGATNRRSISVRRGLISWLQENALSCPPLVSPRALVARGTRFGQGTFVAHGVVVSVDAQVGEFCVLNSGAIIGHDAQIGDNVTIAPGAFIGGACTIGDDGIVGPLAKVLQGMSIGSQVVVGVGTTVMRPVPDGSIVWPSPSRVS